MSSCARKWSFLTVLSATIMKINALSNGAPKAGTVYRNPYTEVDYELACGLSDKQCGKYSSSTGCQKLNCFPYLKYDNEYGIAVDLNGGMTLVFDYCFKSTENCIPANLGSFEK